MHGFPHFSIQGHFYVPPLYTKFSSNWVIVYTLPWAERGTFPQCVGHCTALLCDGFFHKCLIPYDGPFSDKGSRSDDGSLSDVCAHNPKIRASSRISDSGEYVKCPLKWNINFSTPLLLFPCLQVISSSSHLLIFLFALTSTFFPVVAVVFCD